MRYKFSLFDAASNFSDFFFRFHFQGLKSLPKACSLDFLCWGGEPARVWPPPRTPFAFFPATTNNVNCKTWYQYFRLSVRCERPESEFLPKTSLRPEVRSNPGLWGIFKQSPRVVKCFGVTTFSGQPIHEKWLCFDCATPRPASTRHSRRAKVRGCDKTAPALLFTAGSAGWAGTVGGFIGNIRHRQSEGSKSAA